MWQRSKDVCEIVSRKDLSGTATVSMTVNHDVVVLRLLLCVNRFSIHTRRNPHFFGKIARKIQDIRKSV